MASRLCVEQKKTGASLVCPMGCAHMTGLRNKKWRMSRSIAPFYVGWPCLFLFLLAAQKNGTSPLRKRPANKGRLWGFLPFISLLFKRGRKK